MMWHRVRSFLLSTLGQTTVPNRLEHHSATITCLLDSIANDRLSDNFIVRRCVFRRLLSSSSSDLVFVIVSYCIVGIVNGFHAWCVFGVFWFSFTDFVAIRD